MESLLKEIKEQLDGLKDVLASGSCKDMVEYSFICGQARMLYQFRDYCVDKLEKSLVSEDNIDA